MKKEEMLQISIKEHRRNFLLAFSALSILKLIEFFLTGDPEDRTFRALLPSLCLLLGMTVHFMSNLFTHRINKNERDAND